ncbi:MAG: hypothetical protein HY519_02850 [Candidatus Aenigmarchaeota archaeon]|nr:hypothetical protein [Candidatus Aenigmarchaeota archaeon]
MRAFILSLDALIAIGMLLLLAAFLSAMQFAQPDPETIYQRYYYAGKDLLNVLRTAKITDVQSSPVVQGYLQQGHLGQADLNKTLLEVIGAFWSEGNASYAANLTRDIAGSLLNSSGYGYRIALDGETIYAANASVNSTVARLATVVSGLEKGKPVSGFVARASAREATKNTSLIVMGDVITASVCKPKTTNPNQCSGTNSNKINITYRIDIPSDANITSASAFIETAWTDNLFDVYINGQSVQGGAQGSLKLDDIKPYLNPGNNTATVIGRYGAGGPEAGDDGATHWVVNYTTSSLQTKGDRQRFNFQDVKSNTSIRYKLPVMVPGNVTEIQVRVNVTNQTRAKNATLYFGWKGIDYKVGLKNISNSLVVWNDSEIRPFVESKGIYYSDLSSRFFWFTLDIDVYKAREDKSYVRAIDGPTSWVDVNHTSSFPYSYIDVSAPIDLENYANPDSSFGSQGFYLYSRWRMNVSTAAQPLEARWQFAWLYKTNYGNNTRQLARANNITLYDHQPNDGPDPLIAEFARFGYTPATAAGVLASGINTFDLNFSAGYAVNPFNSLGALTVLVPGSVGYGAVFANQTAALADAEARLRAMLGSLATATNIDVDTQSLSGVPTLWGPALLEITVWK